MVTPSTQTPVSLSRETKRTLQRILGLDEMRFTFSEVIGTKTLRRVTWEGGLALPVWSASQKPSGGEVFLDYGKEDKLLVPSFQPTLWEQLFLYPFDLLLNQMGSGSTVRFSTPTLEKTLRQFYEGVTLLEERLSSRELSSIELAQGDYRLALVFHFVRRRCLWVGLLADFEGLNLLSIRGSEDLMGVPQSLLEPARLALELPTTDAGFSVLTPEILSSRLIGTVEKGQTRLEG